MMHSAWAELDLDILKENISLLRSALTPGTKIIFVVKSNAYGHGISAVARQAWACGVTWYAVANIKEARELREVLPESTILVVGVMDPADTEIAIKTRIIPVVVSEEHAHAMAAAATALKKTLQCHVKIDTGMGRLGFTWEDVAKELPALARRGGLEFTGICTHFAASANPKRTFAEIQAERFRKAVSECEAAGLKFPFKHVSNSGAILTEAEWDFDGVRPGILLYGYGPKVEGGRRIPTRPFLQWKTSLVQVKKVRAGFPVSYDSTHITLEETNVGTVNAGYADGYCRLLSNKGFVLVEGARKPVIGRVTMTLATVDLGPSTQAKAGDEVVLLGAQGKAAIWADEIAEWRGTIAYEVLTGIRTDERRVKSA